MASTVPAVGVGAGGPPSSAPTAAEEVAGLDKVLTRLALTDDDKLEKVLQKLIPAVVGQLKSSHDATRKKVLEILSHVNKRLKGLPAMQLPLPELVSMYSGDLPEGTTAALYAMVRNFALVYAEMAAERAAGPELVAVLPGLLSGIARRPSAHQAICLRIAAAALEHQPPPPVGGGSLPAAIPGLQPPSASGPCSEAATAGEGQGGTAAAGMGAAAGPALSPAASASEAVLRAKYPFLADASDRDVFLSFGLKLLLYSPRTSRAPSTPLAAGQAAAAGGPAAAAPAAAAVTPPPPGLSAADVRQFEEKCTPSQEQLSRRKVGLLNLLASAGIGGPPLLLSVTSVLPHLLVAAVDPYEAVGRRAEDLIKRSASLDPGRPAADLDDESLIHRLLMLFHGDGVQLFHGQQHQGTAAGVAVVAGAAPMAAAAVLVPDKVAAPAGPALRSRLAAVFCRSITFANTFPASLLTIQECVMPPQQQQAQQAPGGASAAVTMGSAGGAGAGGGVSGVYARLRQQGLELCVWVFKHAGRHQLKAMGPLVLQGLLDTLDATATAPGFPMDTSTMTLRGFAYQAIGSLAQRVPELLRPRTDIARRFFTALADEPPGVRAAVQEATGALSRAFVLQGAQSRGENRHRQSSPADQPSIASGSFAFELSCDGHVAELDELLLESVLSRKDAVRLCAVQWACRLFPFEHVPARWLCILAAGDAKYDVREEAARGLAPPAKAAAAAATATPCVTSIAAAGGGNSSSGCSHGHLPSLYSLLRYIRRRLPRLRQPADPLAPLPLPPRSCLALIALLRACRHVRNTITTIAREPTASTAVAAAADSGTHGDAMEVDIGAALAAAVTYDEGDAAAIAGGGGADAMDAEGPAMDLDPGLQATDPGSVLSAYACALEAGLCRVEGSSEVAAAALAALLEVAAEDPDEAVARRYAPRTAWLRSFLSHTDPGARLAAAKLLGSHVAAVMEPEAAKGLLDGLLGELATMLHPQQPPGKPTGAGTAAVAGAGGLPASTGVTAIGSGGASVVKQEAAEGYLLTVGFMLGQAASYPGRPTVDASTAAAAVAIMVSILSASDAAGGACAVVPSVLRATAALSLSYGCVVGPQPALLEPLPASAPSKPETATCASDAATVGAMAACVSPPASADTTSSSMEVEGLGASASATAAAPIHSRIQLDLVAEHIQGLLSDKDSKVVSRAAAAAGFLAGGWGGAWGPAAGLVAATDAGPADSRVVSGRLLDGLFVLSTNKSEDVQFAVGEALAWTFGGLSLQPSRVLRANFTTLADHLTATATDEANASTEGAASEAASATAKGGSGEGDAPLPSPSTGMPTSAARGSDGAGPAAPEGVIALRARVLNRLLSELVISPRTEVRCAGAVWLVSLLGFCSGAPDLKGPALPKIQEALSGLLGDPDELTQEMASRGVSLVYRLGDESVREQLVGSLVAVLGGGGVGGGAGRPVKLTADTQVFEEGALGSAPGASSTGGAGGSGSVAGGGGLSTYKELCALATDLGQPDLIYKFMDLAHHAAALNSRRGAAFGFAGIARMAAQGGGAPQDALAKHLAVLVPKLFRYTHDPNPKVAEAMVAIWRSLVDDPRATLDKHFGPVMTDLLREIGGRLWRNRQAACAAMTDLLQGRRWAELAPYFPQLWVMMFRAMDDIKDSVRRAALSLARTVRGLTLRLADPAHTPARECTAAVSAVMPILLEQGLTSNVAEVRALSVEMLGLISKAAPPSALRPLLPTLVPALLEALSSLEDVRLNYVEQHAERLGLDSERLEGARVAAARASPLGDTLDLAARLADGSSLEQLVPALVGTVKRGVGLNTKVGTARFIRNLASRPAALAGAGASASAEGSLLRPHTGPLLRVLSAAVRSELSGTVRRAYAAAAAQVVRHAGEKRLDKFVTEALASYADPAADVDSRLSSGLLLRELMRAAPEKLRMYDAAVLPAAFGAKMDENEEVAAVWAQLWEEGVSSEPAALRLYGTEVSSILCEMLSGQQWGRKKAAAVATMKLTEIAPDALGEQSRRLAASLLVELSVGRLWEGKETVLGAVGALVAANPRVMEGSPGHAAVVDALMAAVSRKKASYRTAALAALEVVLRALPGDHYGRVAPPLLTAVQRHSESGMTVAAALACAAPTAAAGNVGTTAIAGAATTDDDADRPLPLTECLSCLAAAFARVGGNSTCAATAAVSAPAPAPTPETTTATGMDTPEVTAAEASGAAVKAVTEHGSGLAAVLKGVLSAQLHWQPKMAAAQAVTVLAQRCAASGLPHAASAALLGPLAPGLVQSALDHKIQQFRMVALSALKAVVQAISPDVLPTTAASNPDASTAKPGDTVTAVNSTCGIDLRDTASAAGWSEQQRQEMLPGLVSGLQQLAEVDKSAAVAAAALKIKVPLESLLTAPAPTEPPS